MSVVVEHGTFGARAAAPIARDVMTFLFDPAKAWDTLLAMEKSWGGTAAERMDAKYRTFVANNGLVAPKVGDDKAVEAAIDRAGTPENAVVNAGENGDLREEPESAAPQAAPSAQTSPPPAAALQAGSPQ